MSNNIKIKENPSGRSYRAVSCQASNSSYILSMGLKNFKYSLLILYHIHLARIDLKIITDSRIRSIICKGHKYRFPVPIDFKSCREEIAGALQEFCNRWCKREHVESNALNSWKLNIFKIIDGRISFYCNNLDLLPPKPKFTFRHLKKGIQEFHRRFVLAQRGLTIFGLQ